MTKLIKWGNTHKYFWTILTVVLIVGMMYSRM